MTVSIEIPDHLARQHDFSEASLKLKMAVAFFQENTFSLEQAAQFAGLPEADFQQELARLRLAFGATDGTIDLARFVKPMREKTVLEDIIREQGWTGADKKRLRLLIDELAIEEPIEELLADLTA